MAHISSIVSSQNLNSLYIPIISSFINEEFIKYSFHIKNIAIVDRVDFVFNNVKCRREAFVHINSWNDNINSKKMQNALIQKNNYKFYFHEQDNKMFWPLLINKNPLEANSPERVSNSVYTIEDKIEAMNQHLNTLQSIALSHNAMLQNMNVPTENMGSNKRFKPNDTEYTNDYIPPVIPITRQNAFNNTILR